MAPLTPKPFYNHPVMRSFWTGWSVGQRVYARAQPIPLAFSKLYLIGDFLFPFWILLFPVFLFPYDLATEEERATVWLMLVLFRSDHALDCIATTLCSRICRSFLPASAPKLYGIWPWRSWDKPVGFALVGLIVLSMSGVAVYGPLCTRENTFSLLNGPDITTRGLAADGSRFKPARAFRPANPESAIGRSAGYGALHGGAQCPRGMGLQSGRYRCLPD